MASFSPSMFFLFLAPALLFETTVTTPLNDAAGILNQAIDFASDGDMASAMPLFRDAVALAPTSPDIIFNAAYANIQVRELPTALGLLQRLLEIRPDHREAHIKIAMVLRDLGRTAEVVPHLESALKLDPNNPNVYAYLGDTLNNMKRWHSAIDIYMQGLAKIDPTFIAALDKGTASAPTDDDHNSDKQKRKRKRKRKIQSAHDMHPQQVQMAVEAHRSLGDALLNVKRSFTALRHFRRALALHPEDGETIASLWYARLDLNDWSYNMHLSSSFYSEDIDDLARRAFTAATATLRLQEQQSSTYAKQETKDKHSLRPSTLSPYRTLFLPIAATSTVLPLVASWGRRLVADELTSARDGHILDGGSTEEAVRSTLKETGAGVTQNAMRRSEALRHQPRFGYLSRRFERYPGTQLMLGLFAAHATRHLQYDGDSSKVAVYAYAYGPDDGSSERAAIESIYNYSTITSVSKVGGEGGRHQAKSEGNGRFTDISDLSPAKAAAVVRNDALDVLIDYDGSHDFNSVSLLAHRPAGIVATWLGFAQTPGLGRRLAGASCVDYFVTDRFVTDPVEARSFAESLVVLPHSYQPQDELQNDVAYVFGLVTRTRLQLHRSLISKIHDIDPSNCSSDGGGSSDGGSSSDGGDDGSMQSSEPTSVEGRSFLKARVSRETSFHRIRSQRSRRFGFPDDATVLAALVRSNKLTPTVFSDFMYILQRTENTFLWLQGGDQSGDTSSEDWRRGRLRAEMAARGVAPSRLVFGGRVNRTEYFERLASADLFLDVRPYGAHTVAADALWCGTPVLTLPGAALASRVGLSLLRAAANAADAAIVDRTTEAGKSNGAVSAARSAAAILVASSAKEFVDTAVLLCSNFVSHSRKDQDKIGRSILLERLRSRITEGISPSITHMQAVATGESAIMVAPKAVPLFNSAAFAASIERTVAAMSEVKSAAAIGPGVNNRDLLSDENRALPHIFFAS